MVYEISKKFTIDCAHRVYNQILENMEEKCKQIHGHTYEIEVFLTSDRLNNDMVLDFNRLNIVKEFLNNFLDHRLIISVHDTELIDTINDSLRGLGRCKAIGLNNTFTFISLNPDVLRRHLEKQKALKLYHDNVLINSVTLIPCNSTSECLAYWLLEVCQQLIPNIKVSKITVKETPKSQAMYMG